MISKFQEWIEAFTKPFRPRCYICRTKDGNIRFRDLTDPESPFTYPRYGTNEVFLCDRCFMQNRADVEAAEDRVDKEMKAAGGGMKWIAQNIRREQFEGRSGPFDFGKNTRKEYIKDLRRRMNATS